MKHIEQMSLFVANVADRVLTAQHAQFSRVTWQPCSDVYVYTPFGPGGAERIDDMAQLPRSGRYDADPLAWKHLPNTWKRVAAIAIEAAYFEALRDVVPGGVPAVYRYASPEACDVGVLPTRRLGYPIQKVQIGTRDEYRHAIRLGHTGGEFGLGMWSPDQQLYTVPKDYMTFRGPLGTKVGFLPIELPPGLHFS